MSGDDDDDAKGDLFPEVAQDNAADRAAVKRKETRVQREKREARRFWRTVFASDVGRREMWAILQNAGAFATPFACGPNGFPQPEATWFKEGQREFGLRLYQSWLIMDRKGVFLMHEENDANFSDIDEDQRIKE